MKCEKNENLIKKEYFKCERELKINTEEVEKLKTEIKDLKEITSLSKELKEVIKTTESGSTDKCGFKVKSGLKDKSTTETTNLSEEHEDNMNPWKKISKKQNDSQKDSPFKFKRKANIEEEEFNCNDCDYQGYSNTQLTNHINLKHVRRNASNESSNECKYCGEKN